MAFATPPSTIATIIPPFRLVGYNISMKPPYEDDPNWITGWCPKCNDWKTFYHDSLSEKNRTKLLPSCPDCHTMIVQFQSRRSWRPTAKPKKYKRR